MTATTETAPFAHPPVAPGEAPTAPLQPDSLGTAGDALDRLDHRSLERTLAPEQASPGHYLALGEAGRERLLALSEGITHLGRSGSADVRFEHPQVSRRHAIIARYGHHVRALDDRSSAGTFVNARRIVAVDLEDGDVVRFGPLSARYVRVG
jgi:pSer/pThr/pTyr-binding forkhead associated (FHA) protein